MTRKLSKAARSAAIKAGIARARRERAREARKKSEAAKRGWETRRKNARRTKRIVAAEKRFLKREGERQEEQRIKRRKRVLGSIEFAEAEEYVAIGEYIGD